MAERKCPASSKEYSACKKLGHSASMCKTKKVDILQHNPLSQRKSNLVSLKIVKMTLIYSMLSRLTQENPRTGSC